MPPVSKFQLLWGSTTLHHYLASRNRRKRKPVDKIYRLRGELGEFHHLYPSLRQNEDLFYSYSRMKIATYDYIVDRIKEKFSHYVPTNFQFPISVEERLMLTLRYLATGISYRQLAFSFRISRSSVSRIVKEVCIAIWESLVHDHMPIPSKDKFEIISREFHELWGFPHALGCIDGKHIEIKCPPKAGSMFFNYKQFHSIVLMAVTDARYRFIMVDVGSYGKDSDGAVFAHCPFVKEIECGNLQLPAERTLPGSSLQAPFVFLGDEGFPLRFFLMRPFPWKQAKSDDVKKKFNYQLSRARMTVECGFGIMAAKFRLLHKPIETDVNTAEDIVRAITLLHNVIIDKQGLVDFQPSAQTQSVGLRNVQPSRSTNRGADSAISIRNKFSQFFMEN